MVYKLLLNNCLHLISFQTKNKEKKREVFGLIIIVVLIVATVDAVMEMHLETILSSFESETWQLMFIQKLTKNTNSDQIFSCRRVCSHRELAPTGTNPQILKQTQDWF